MLSRFLNWLTDGTVGAVFGLVVLGSTLSSFFNWFADITIGVVFGFGAGLLEAVFADAALALLLLPLLFELEALPRDFLFILGFGILDGIVSGVGALDLDFVELGSVFAALPLFALVVFKLFGLLATVTAVAASFWTIWTTG